MEWFTIILSGLLVALTPANLIIDQVIANNIRHQVKDVEVLEVRVDNDPNFQALQGKIDKIRIATRGIEPIEKLRIDVLEIETDPIAINLKSDFNNLTAIRQALEKPLQGGIRLEITETDLNIALQSDQFTSQLQKIIDGFLPEGSPQFKIQTLQIQFLENQRFQVNVNLQQLDQNNQETDKLTLEINTGIEVIEGRSLKFVDPQATLNNRRLSSRFLTRLLNGVGENLSLNSLEKQGVTIRMIQYNLTEDRLNLALFFRVEPDSK